MNTIEFYRQPQSSDSGRWTVSLIGLARYLACIVVILMATSVPSVPADAQINGYVGPIASGQLHECTNR
jgi:hypothetical protein